MPSLDAAARILVLDDDEIFRDLLDALLATEGFAVTLASSGVQALALLQRNSVDLVLTDLHMPGLEGQELARSLRSALPPATLLIGMSSAEPPVELRLLLDAFVLKPFDVQLLRDVIGVAQEQNDIRNRIYTKDQAPHLEPAPMAASPLDEETFTSLAKIISPSQLGELFAMALKDIGKRYTRMTEAKAANDLFALQREAHAVKGSCGMLGALELQSLAATIEEASDVHTSALEEIPQACTRLERMLKTKFYIA